MARYDEMDEALQPGVRYATDLLDLAPAGSVVYVSMPNMSDELGRAYEILQDRVATSAVLSQWWDEYVIEAGGENELEKIIEHLGDVTPDEIAFVRREFEAPLDAQGFVRSVPRGMEQEVYVVSLMAIDLDSNPEAQYLHQLAQATGIGPDVVNQIHERLGAPKIYR